MWCNVRPHIFEITNKFRWEVIKGTEFSSHSDKFQFISRRLRRNVFLISSDLSVTMLLLCDNIVNLLEVLRSDDLHQLYEPRTKKHLTDERNSNFSTHSAGLFHFMLLSAGYMDELIILNPHRNTVTTLWSHYGGSCFSKCYFTNDTDEWHNWWRFIKLYSRLLFWSIQRTMYMFDLILLQCIKPPISYQVIAGRLWSWAHQIVWTDPYFSH